MIAVFDLDGTLCDNSTREHLAHEENLANPRDADRIWEEFHSRIAEEQPIRPVLHTLYALQSAGAAIEIWTARPDRYRSVTEEWLNKYKVQYKVLMMRPDNDLRQSYIIKLGWFFLGDKPDIMFEDHPEVVRLMRKAGVVVAQVGNRVVEEIR